MIEALLISLGVNTVFFLFAYFMQTDKLTDFAYSLSFATLVIVATIRNDLSGLQYVLVLMVLIWAFRLGSYLVIRIKAMGRDKRFDEMRSSFFKFGGFWLLQAVTAWIVLIPTLLALGESDTLRSESIAVAGIAIAFAGLAFEAIADQQKFQFIQQKSNKGKWIDTGLWRFSQHPNYFGEIVMWIGMYVAALAWLDGWQLVAGLISPLFIATMLLFVSGIPLLDKAAQKRWSSDKKYQAYRERTSKLIPLPPRK